MTDTKFTAEFIEEIRDNIRHSLTFKFMQREAAKVFNAALDEIERLQKEIEKLQKKELIERCKVYYDQMKEKENG